MRRHLEIVKPIIKYKYITDIYNAIEYLNKIAKENPVKGIILDIAKLVITRNRIPKELFTDNNHYMIYRQYFKGYPYRIVLSEDYLLVDNLIPVISRLNRCYYYCDEDSKKDIYVYLDRWIFGINSDYKLFINHIDRERYIRLSKLLSKYYESCVKDSNTDRYVCVITPVIEYRESDLIRFDYLGYEIDSNNEENISIIANGLYRIQGEVLFNFRYMDIDNIVNIIVNEILTQLRNDINRIINTYLLIKIRDYLSRYGFSNMEIFSLENSTFYLRIRDCITKDFYNSHKDKISKALNVLKENIYQYLLNDVILDKLMEYVIRVNPFIHIRDNYIDIDIEISNAHIIYLYEICNYVREHLLKSVKELVDNKVYKEYTVYHGNHLIKIQSIPLEYSIDIPSEINPLKQLFPENDIIMNANLRNNTRFYVLPGFKASIKHNQHGITNVIFENPGEITIFDTRISTEHLEFQNRVAFKNMINQLLNNNNNNNNRKITEYINGVE